MIAVVQRAVGNIDVRNAELVDEVGIGAEAADAGKNDGLFAPDLADGGTEQRHAGGIERRAVGGHHAAGRDGNVLIAALVQMLTQQLQCFLRRLIGDEVQIETAGRGVGNDVLYAVGVAGADVTDVAGRLIDVVVIEVVARAVVQERGDLQRVEHGLRIEGNAVDGVEVHLRERGNVVVEVVELYKAVLALECAQKRDETPDGTRHGGSIHGVQVLFSALYRQVDGAHTLEAEEQDRTARFVDFGVRGEKEVGLEHILVLGNELGQMRAADLFLAVEDELEIHGDLAVQVTIRFVTEQIGHRLALVVGGAAAVDLAVDDGRLKGLCVPCGDRLDRHDIIMAVNQDRGRVVGIVLFTENVREAVRRIDSGGKAVRFQHREQKLSAVHHGIDRGGIADRLLAQERT